MNDEEDFQEIIQESYEYVKPVSREPITKEQADRLAEEFVLGLDPAKKEDVMKEKASALDGIICLFLFVVSVGLITWAAFDIGWDQVRLLGGVISFSILYNFSKRFSAKG